MLSLNEREWKPFFLTELFPIIQRGNAMFIVSEINKQSGRYSYGYIRNNNRIAREKLMLPVDKHGNPDYAYMEQCGRNMMVQKYEQYLSYLNSKESSER